MTPVNVEPHRKHKATFADAKRCSRCENILPFSAFHHARTPKNRARDVQGYCKICVIRVNRLRRATLRIEVIRAYGSQCVCCGERRDEFLTIDHVNGGGNKHRKQLANMSSSTFYQWLKANKFPQNEFRCLCANCNFSRGYKGYCPHERERQQEQAG